MKYLAFGIVFESGSTNSLEVDTDNPAKVEKQMNKEWGYDKGYFDQVFLIKNSRGSPEVHKIFNRQANGSLAVNKGYSFIL